MATLVIGAGISGLAAVKSCLECGLHVSCVEKSACIGGVWNTVSNSCAGRMYEGLVTNTSKYMTGFSDFPFSSSETPYVSHTLMRKYVQDYADRFNLEKFIRFGVAVDRVLPLADGTYEVVMRNVNTNVLETCVYENVIVCTGRNTYPHYPSIPGLQSFTGTHIHSRDYTSAEPLRGKRVVVVGAGSSAADIACAASTLASSVHMSVRSAVRVLPKIGPNGEPLDYSAHKRITLALPNALTSAIAKRLGNFLLGPPENYGFRDPDDLNKGPNLPHGDISIRIMEGKVRVESSIDRICGSTIHFTSGSSVECDWLIFATGYEVKCSIVQHPSASIVSGGENLLYKHVFPPNVKRPGSLSFIGMISVNGAVPPLVEMQSRWVASVISGQSTLPSPSDMISHLTQQTQKGNPYGLHPYSVHYSRYQMEIAAEVGASVDWVQLLWKSPEVALATAVGPVLPSQFRLCGPGAWAPAGDFIINHKRGLFGRTTRPIPQSYSGWCALACAVLLGLLIACLLSFLL